ncbi:hypothetical protein BABINDRAFT_129816 [Babjeviella inositovora NRRL Y-12698]|uniref:Rgp1-domain-containing protein n=1 Tax=Babjeviella inositovora NRRL Y-12698 TaxID=984486 RepID=A0A1E3QRC3_9ASCO|nr:uncharacterized protein BABINDRAFT_129816 [Babjeviella inositovora NRRL Y-12698]ODQ80200.1 hypothetical protein BABINDRAFT_129816 [Babjeviella inositovora NRRL Y-12698]
MSHSHTVFKQPLSKKVRVEVVYETSPVFAKEELSLIVRFKNVLLPTFDDFDIRRNGSDSGSTQDVASITTTKEDAKAESWFGTRLSMQFSSAKRLLMQREIETIEDEDLSETILLGYIQLFGNLSLNEEIMNPEPFEAVQKKAIVGGRMAGITGLEVSRAPKPFFSSRDELANRNNVATSEFLQGNIIPLFSSPQSLLFTEITLHPGETRSFHFKTALPQDIPPTYHGGAVDVSYQVIVGSLDALLVRKSLFFPFKLHPWLDRWGNQPQYTLMDPIIVVRDEATITEIKSHRKPSFKALHKNSATETESQAELERKTEFLAQLKKLDSRRQSISEVHPNGTHLTVRESIFLLADNLAVGDVQNTEVAGLSPQIGRSQRKFKISRKSVPIATVTLGKAVVKLGEDIQVFVDFSKDTPVWKTSGLVVSLCLMEDIRSVYLADPSSSSPTASQQNKTCVDSVALNTLDCQQAAAVVHVPLAATSQFQSDVVDVSWKLEFEFVLLSLEKDGSVYKLARDDSNGTLFVDSGDLSGFMLNVAVPITVLPSDQELVGVVFED